MKTKLLIAVLFLFIAMILWFVFSSNYPIVFANLESISAFDFNKNYAASLAYYKNALETYSKDSKVLDSDEVKKEIERALMESMIEDILVGQELEKDIGKSDLDKLVNKKISESAKNQDADIQKAAEKLYGFSFDEFEKRILVPQAKKEILESRIFLAGGNFEEKLKEMKSKAQVMIFLPGFEWKDGKVIIKQ